MSLVIKVLNIYTNVFYFFSTPLLDYHGGITPCREAEEQITSFILDEKTVKKHQIADSVRLHFFKFKKKKSLAFGFFKIILKHLINLHHFSLILKHWGKYNSLSRREGNVGWHKKDLLNFIHSLGGETTKYPHKY